MHTLHFNLHILYGYSRKQIAEILHIHHQTSCAHISSYQKGETDTLLLPKQTRAPGKLSDEQEHTLIHIISTQTPEEADVGIFANWTSSLACKFAEERFGVVFSDWRMRNLFDRVGLSYTTTYTLEKANPEKQEQFKKDFETLKKLLNNDVARILFEDESMIRDYQAVMKIWFLKGKQRIIPTIAV